MPMAMLSLALVMLVTAVTGSYAIAGAVSATGAVLYAAVTPRAARLADRYGQARVLRPQVIVFAGATAALAACAASRAPVWALFVTGGFSRATMPSLGPMVRSRWSRLLGGSALLDAAFSLEGIADELIFITGPVLVVALAVGVTPVAGVLGTAALSVAGVAGVAGQRTEAMSWLTTAAATGTAGYLFAFAAGLTAMAIAVLRRCDLARPRPGAAHPGKRWRQPQFRINR